jgi:hypothetical protein
MTSASAVDREADVFADILCADQEWIDLEFEEIIAGLRPTPRSGSAPSQRPDGGGPRFEDSSRRRDSRWQGLRRPRSSIRSPPRNSPPRRRSHHSQ